MADFRVFKATSEDPTDEVDLAVSLDAGGMITVEAGTVKLAGSSYPISSTAFTLALDRTKAASIFGMLRRHKTTGVIDLGLYQFNAGAVGDFGASYDLLYQFIRGVIPVGTAIADVVLDCWITKGAP